MASDKVMIQLTPELRKQLQILKVRYSKASYDELLEFLLKKNGYWDPALEEE